MNSFTIIEKTHFVVVTIFFLIYLVKTVLLLANKTEQLQSFSKKVKVPEMIVSFLFLATGIYLMTQVPVIGSMLIIKITLVFLSIPLAVVGFKKLNKGLAALSFVCLLAAFGLGEMSAKKKTAVVTAGDTKADGTINAKEIYTNNCATCHGDDGKKGMAGAADISSTTLSTDSISVIIEKGRKSMPAVQGLTPEQLKAVSQYVHDSLSVK